MRRVRYSVVGSARGQAGKAQAGEALDLREDRYCVARIRNGVSRRPARNGVNPGEL